MGGRGMSSKTSRKGAVGGLSGVAATTAIPLDTSSAESVINTRPYVDEYNSFVDQIKNSSLNAKEKEAMYGEAHSAYQNLLNASVFVSPTVAGGSNFRWKSQHQDGMARQEKARKSVGELKKKFDGMNESAKMRDPKYAAEVKAKRARAETMKHVRMAGGLMSLGNKSEAYSEILKVKGIDSGQFKSAYEAFDKQSGVSRRSKLYKEYEAMFGSKKMK